MCVILVRFWHCLMPLRPLLRSPQLQQQLHQRYFLQRQWMSCLFFLGWLRRHLLLF
uniref:Uncharacterized protein n=1 Tax=uncultured marine virus TaxID=186617 RepID=A0A0F7L2V3_9VIRU|nr:hypothetical protein [uncultured marine virus]